MPGAYTAAVAGDAMHKDVSLHGTHQKGIVAFLIVSPGHLCNSESNTKVPKFDGNNTSCCSDKGVGCARREKTLLRQECTSH